MTISIVVVDDEETARYIVRRAVQALSHDCNFVEFGSGIEFLDVIQDKERREHAMAASSPPMLVLLDINMPSMNGFEVLEALDGMGEVDQRLMIVTMYSSSNHADDRADAFRYEFVKKYVVKPITPEILESLVKEFSDSA